jgi:nucleoside-diphosphate-sugar epimerase
MTVLVTGACGFLGSHVTELLLESGEQPRALVRPSDHVGGFPSAEVDIRTADVADAAAVAVALRGVERVVHCAARTGPWGPQAEYERTNVRGLETLVRAAMAAGVRRVVHVSSITVHGNDVRGEVDEQAPLRAEPNPYSLTKVAGERVLERMIRDERAPVTIVRPGWIYGPRDAASFGRLAQRIQRRQMIMIGSGENHLPLIYARDVARGVLLASQAPQAEGRSYLLVNDEPVTQREFLAAIAAELNAPPPTRRIPHHLAEALGAVAEAIGRLTRTRPPVMRYGMQLLGGENRFGITRAREELGFSPQVNVADGVRLSVAWYRETIPDAPAASPRAWARS